MKQEVDSPDTWLRSDIGLHSRSHLQEVNTNKSVVLCFSLRVCMCVYAQFSQSNPHSLWSQFWPVQPGRHSQKYPPIRLRQALALTQGLSAHSSASEEGEPDRGPEESKWLTVGRWRKGASAPLTYEAGLPLPLGGAGAPEAADQVLAGSSVLTGAGQTRPLHWGDKTLGFFPLLHWNAPFVRCTAPPTGRASILSQLAILASHCHSLTGEKGHAISMLVPVY